MKATGVLAVPCQCGSGRPLGECHGSRAPSADDLGLASVAPEPATRRLALACGQRPKAGYEGVDIWPGAQHVVDLQCFPWPFESGSIAEINCEHYIEHIPMVMVNGKDALFAFFDECYRILAPDGVVDIVVPAHRSDRAFQDPTHRRFITQQTFFYLSATWRKANGLDHYNVECNFSGEVNPAIDVALSLRYPEVVQKKITHEWNSVNDWVAKLRKLPPLT